jgi:hypothetical protein
VVYTEKRFQSGYRKGFLAGGWADMAGSVWLCWWRTATNWVGFQCSLLTTSLLHHNADFVALAPMSPTHCSCQLVPTWLMSNGIRIVSLRDRKSLEGTDYSPVTAGRDAEKEVNRCRFN